jgi:HK97 family phage major capsid protein
MAGEIQEIVRAQEEFGREWKTYREENDRRLKEIEEKGFEPAEWKDRFAKMDAAIETFDEHTTKMLKEFKENKERIEVLETAARRPKTTVDGKELTPEQLEYKEKIDKYLRSGETAGVKELEAKVLRTSVNTDGGYALSTEREAGILGRLRDTSPMRTYATVRPIAAAEWEQMRITGHASGGGWVSEQGTRSTTTTPTFGMVKVTPGEHYEQPPVTQMALDDLTFDVEQFLEDEVAAAMAIRENTAYILGDGVGKPRGIMTYTAGTDDTLFQVQQVNGGHATLLQADGLIDCQDALNEAYQANATWCMRRATKTLVRKLKQPGTGDYLLFDREFGEFGPVETILGKPVWQASDVAAVAANALAYAYGDFRQAYLIVDKQGVRVLRDPYTSKPNVLFYTTKRTGGGIVRPQAIKIGKIAA